MGARVLIVVGIIKKVDSVTSMGCVHMHQRILAIEGCGNPSCIWSTVQKDGEDNWKVGKVGWVGSQKPTLGPKHDKIQAQCVSNILSKSMLKRVWWCKRSKMESWSQTICCLMRCSKGRRHANVKGGRRSQATLRCCWKGKVLLSICVKALRRKEGWSTINLTTMMETTRAQLLKWVVKVMVVISMKPMLLKAIGKKVCYGL